MDEQGNGPGGRAKRRASGRELRQLRRLAGHLAPYRWRVVATLVALALAAAAVLVFGVGIRYLIDGGFGARHAGALDHALKASLVVIVVLAGATFARAYLVGWLGERLVADLRTEVYARVTALSPGFFELTRTGEILSRLTSDTAVIQTVISSSLSQALRNLLLLIGGLGLLIVTNPKLTGLILIVVPLVVVPIVVIGRRVRRLSRLAQDRIDHAPRRFHRLVAGEQAGVATQRVAEQAFVGRRGRGALVARDQLDVLVGQMIEGGEEPVRVVLARDERESILIRHRIRRRRMH